MTRDLPESASERRVLELLPWYVNGTLQGDELEDVRLALRSSLVLRREHERLARIQRLMQEDDAEHVATDRSYERLMSRIQRRRRWQSPVFWQAAALLVVASGLGLWWNAAPTPPPFETLTTPDFAAAPSLRVVFAADVSDEVRRALLAEHGLTVDAPPTAEGVYTLVLPAAADARAIADALRADPRVTFASTPPASGKASGP